MHFFYRKIVRLLIVVLPTTSKLPFIVNSNHKCDPRRKQHKMVIKPAFKGPFVQGRRSVFRSARPTNAFNVLDCRWQQISGEISNEMADLRNLLYIYAEDIFR